MTRWTPQQIKARTGKQLRLGLTPIEGDWLFNHLVGESAPEGKRILNKLALELERKGFARFRR